jgi:Raf kinase inhibitor-like YbhB/YbcL family protein
MELHSTSFKAAAKIPPQFTCEGENISPPLTWTDVPEGTKSFALIVEDPDAPKGTFTHWIAYNIPPALTGLAPDAGGKPDGFIPGKNDFGKLGYGGPCPPPGHGDHRYFFHLFALDKTLDLPSGATKAELEKAMTNRILDHAQMMGKFGRR